MFFAFSYAVYVDYNFSSKEQASFNFMVAATICSDFGVQKNSLSLILGDEDLFLSKETLRDQIWFPNWHAPKSHSSFYFPYFISFPVTK